MYEVQKIVSSRTNSKGKKEYLVKWVGYNSNQNTWQPEKNLLTVKPMISRFEKKQTAVSQKVPSNEQGSQKSQSVCSEAEVERTTLSKVRERLEQHTTSEQRKTQVKPQHKLVVTGMAYDKEGKYIYRVYIDGQNKWVRRSFLTPHFLKELCQFYEAGIVVKD